MWRTDRQTDRQRDRHGVLIELLVAVKNTKGHELYTLSGLKKIKRNRLNEEFDSCDRPSNPTQIRFKSSFFQPVWPWNYAQFGAKSAIFFVPCSLEIWRMTLKKNRATLLYSFKFCASLHSHQWIQSGVTVRKRPILVKIEYFLAVWSWNLTNDIKKNGAPLISNIKLCASFHHHMWIQTGVTIRKRLSWV